MKALFKKRFFSLLLALIFVVMLTCGCNNSDAKILYRSGFSVHFLDVGQGDCIFIRLPDGKNMVIDAGAKDKDIYKYVRDCLAVYNVSTIDYFIITHPDMDHVGNAQSIATDYTIQKAYIPALSRPMSFEYYSGFYSTIVESDVGVVNSSVGVSLSGTDWFACFLSPLASDIYGSEYAGINKKEPTDSDINNASAVVYLEYAGVRFLFTGDAQMQVETSLLQRYKSDGYKRYYGDRVVLESIDFLKISHHGANDASSQEFLQALQPKNAVISVGGNNFYGHPATSTINRIITANPNCNVLRTDVYGSISVFVSSNGQIETVKTLNE